jgi:hypothetical protein
MTQSNLVKNIAKTSKKNFDEQKFYRLKRDYPRLIELVKKGVQLEETLQKDNK